MPSAFDAISADAASVLHDAFAVSAVYTHISGAPDDAITLIDHPGVQIAPAGFDAYAVKPRHEVSIQRADLSEAPVEGDSVTFESVAYRIDEIIADDEIEFRAIVVGIP